MKKTATLILATLVLALFSIDAAQAQDEKTADESGYHFTDVNILPHTSVKDQNRSGTCWSYAGTSFVESEVLRKGGPELDLSEMYSVRNAYQHRAKGYMRMHGAFNFGPGGEPHQVMETIAEKGMCTNDAYNGLTIGDSLPVHGEMDNVLLAFVKAVEQNKNGTLTPVWYEAYNGILDAYLGKVPQQFDYNGKTYTPETFAGEVIDLDPADYAEITSYTHADYYKPFLLMIPDNWDFQDYYNVPLNDLTAIIDHALNNGYTVAWAADVSDPGFNHKKGLAIVPEKKWSDMSKGERDSAFITPVKQRTITPAMREKAYDDYATTDDHSMHIIGTAKDQDGNIWYKVKNSWGTDSNDFGGYFYASKPYIQYKTIAIYVNKAAVPGDISQKLGW